MERWEYKSISIQPKGFIGGIVDLNALETELNALGNQGWELVACFGANAGYGRTRNAVSILKRKQTL